MVLAGPDIDKQTNYSLVSLNDILPTAIDLTDANFNQSKFDGVSLVSLFNKRNGIYHDRNILIEYAGINNSKLLKLKLPPYKVLRMKESKYVEYEDGEFEYYNLKIDPDEYNNLYTTIKTSEKLELKNKLKELIDN